MTDSQWKTLAGECDKFIALVCHIDDCRVATVVPRDPKIDGRKATSMRLRCPGHSEEGEIVEYYDFDGNEVDPFEEVQKQKELEK